MPKFYVMATKQEFIELIIKAKDEDDAREKVTEIANEVGKLWDIQFEQENYKDIVEIRQVDNEEVQIEEVIDCKKL